MTKVMVFGTFDVLHPGHVHMLKEAREYGDCLVVVIARDETVCELKGKKPRYPEDERARNIEKLEIADKVILGCCGNNKHQVVIDEAPDVVALGYDQHFFLDNLENALKSTAKIVRLTPHAPEIYKSSKLPPDFKLDYEKNSGSDN